MFHPRYKFQEDLEIIAPQEMEHVDCDDPAAVVAESC